MHSIAETSAGLGATGAMGVTSSAVTPQPRLAKAAQEFEAQMMQELLKPLTSGNGLDGEDSDTASGSGGALGAFASEALGRGLSEHGGFGIATGIMRQLTPASNPQVTAQVTGKLHGNTVIKTHE
jgi:Rod binding domain-containing protein